MRKLAITTLCAFSLSFVAIAQEESGPTLSFSGSADTYFRVNLNSTNDATNGGMLAPGTSFANGSGFSLGMFNLITSFSTEKVGFVADIVAGPRGTEAVFGSPAPLTMV
ncbi:MAG: outer membrane beta-barrel protein, partial [Bacteroidota bacterium]